MARTLQFDFSENNVIQFNDGTLGYTYNATAAYNRYEQLPSTAGSFHLSSSSDKITVPHGTGIDDISTMSFEMIYYPDALTSGGRLFDKGSSIYNAWIDASGIIHIRRYAVWGYKGWKTSSSVVSTGSWHHIQIAWNGWSGTPLIKVNDSTKSVTDESTEWWWIPQEDANEAFVIGNKASTSADTLLDGKIAYVALWNEVKDSSGFTTEYNNQKWRYTGTTVQMPVRNTTTTVNAPTVIKTTHATVYPPVRDCTAAKGTATPLISQSRTSSPATKTGSIVHLPVVATIHHSETKSMPVRDATTTIYAPTVFTVSRAETTITADTDVDPPGSYKPFTISGRLAGTVGDVSVPNRTITITRVTEEHNYISTVGTSVTNTGGIYSLRFAESVPGDYIYKIDFPGDSMEQEPPLYAPSFYFLEVTVTVTMPIGYTIVADDVTDFVNSWDTEDTDFSGYSLHMDITNVTTTGVQIKPTPVTVDEKTNYRFSVECKADVVPTAKITCKDVSSNVTQIISRSYPECADDPTDVHLCTVSFWTPVTTTTVEILFGAFDLGSFHTDNYRLNEIISSGVMIVPCDTVEMSTALLVDKFSHLYKKEEGSNFYQFIDAFGQEFDNLRRVKEEIRRGYHIHTATEQDLDEIGALLNSPRVGGEMDSHYRRRLMATGAGAMEGVTIASIKRVCELYTGIIPQVMELWLDGNPNCPWEPYCPVGPAIVVGFRNYKQMKLSWDDTFDLILRIRDAGIVVYMGPITDIYDFIRLSETVVVTSNAFACALIDVSKVNMCEVC